MGDNGIAQALHLVHSHAGIGRQGKVIGLEALVNEAVDSRMYLVTHRLDNNAVDSIMVALARLLEGIET